MRSVSFPYSLYKGFATPIAPIEIKGKPGWVRIWAYVDSGASYSLFGVEEAERLGINFRKGRESKITVGDGSLIPFYLHVLKVKIGRWEITAPIGFSEKLGVGFNLLGRAGIFTQFDITFSDSRKKVIFRKV